MMDVSTKPQYQQLPTSCVQCCSALADDRPLSAACWYSGLQFLSPLCSNPSIARCPSCTSQGCHQLFVMPGRNLPTAGEWQRAFCASLHILERDAGRCYTKPARTYCQQEQFLGMVLKQCKCQNIQVMTATEDRARKHLYKATYTLVCSDC